MSIKVDHQKFQELLGAYALHAVEDDESLIMQLHVDECSECRDELDQHLDVVSLLSSTERFAPTDLWETIADEIPDARTLNEPGAFRRHPPAASGLKSSWVVRAAALAAVLAMFSTSVIQTVRLNNVNADLAVEQSTVAALTEDLQRPPLDMAVEAALSDSEGQRVILGSQVSGSNAIIVLMSDGTGYVVEHTLQPLPADRTYQLWAIIDGKIISAGILGSNPGVVPFRIDPDGFAGFAITEESLGGVEASTNDPVVAWLDA
ncbi:MAG: anti-sigma factor [Acidimicrobiia bacterium]|nr:anti-sigma factor [Acidimicrobiia bacterium]